MREQIQYMQQLQLAGTLASGIAHDLNNELTLILGNLELALDRLPAGYDACDSLESAKTAASRCAGMSRRLLYLGRPTRSIMQQMDVASAIQEAHELLECIKPPNTQISAECEPGMFMIGDTVKIQQVLINLGTNAFDAMPHGGLVEIRGCRSGSSISITVSDNGCGIPKSVSRRIFAPFFTTRAETGGSGLGLATAKVIVNRHGGMLGFESTPGEGTTFLLEFPAVDEEDTPETSADC
jgi:signal transduction histidine kinase